MKTTFKLVFSFMLLFFIALVAYKTVSAYGLTPAGAPICNNGVPGTPTLKTLKSLGGGSVELTWDNVASASSWTVGYGVQSGKYIYGVHNFGDSASRGIKINELPGGTYYFALRANNGCMPGAFSGEKTISLGGTSSGQPVTFETTPSTEDEQEVVTTPTPTKKTTLSPTPKTSPVPTQAPKAGGQTQKLSFWQRFVNFFKNLFK